MLSCLLAQITDCLLVADPLAPLLQNINSSDVDGRLITPSQGIWCVCERESQQLTPVLLLGWLLGLIAFTFSQRFPSGMLLYRLSSFTQMDLPDEEPDRLSNRLLQYDPSQDRWTERAPMKFSKYRFSTAVVNSEIYVLGKTQQILKRA